MLFETKTAVGFQRKSCLKEKSFSVFFRLNLKCRLAQNGLNLSNLSNHLCRCNIENVLTEMSATDLLFLLHRNIRYNRFM